MRMRSVNPIEMNRIDTRGRASLPHKNINYTMYATATVARSVFCTWVSTAKIVYPVSKFFLAKLDSGRIKFLIHCNSREVAATS